MGDAFRFDWPQDDLFCLLRARRGLLRYRTHSRGHEGGRGFRGRILHHRLDVRRRICPLPGYLADIFGARFVGAIHGRLLTAWSTAGIMGPVIVNFLHDTRMAQGVPRDHVYDLIFYVLACLLVAGFICNALIRSVHAKGI